ncbi:unnamed protein product [Mytilus edulis]|uniref:Ig-like domain-containing protein n=1 Tax=Mytilus edulis TaxID=6550 RepID=A0A8S3V7M5_MYTED|nr:unnamed protein product [Mytilus edulis]
MYVLDTFGDIIRSNVSIHTYIGDTVVLACNLTFGATNNRWRRLKDIISKATAINLENPYRRRYEIIGQLRNDEYNLQISNVYQSDSGLYWCEMNINGTITKQIYTLYISGNNSKTTVNNTDPGEAKIVTSSGINNQQTVENTDPGESETVTNSGRSCQGEFYHGIIGAGLILASCLLVICSACFNRKCRTKTLEQR